MKNFYTIFICLILSELCSANSWKGINAEQIKDDITNSTWFSVMGEWESPPQDLGPVAKRVGMEVIRFYENGKFLKLKAEIIDNDGTWSCSDGNNVFIFIGNWFQVGKQIKVKYQFISSRYKIVGFPRDEVNGEITKIGNQIFMDDVPYAPTKSIKENEIRECVGNSFDTLMSR